MEKANKTGRKGEEEHDKDGKEMNKERKNWHTQLERGREQDLPLLAPG